ncbi:MAG: hypothetical protein ACR2OZ_05250 [Verrucomicrobiales bacterium]
MKIRRVQDEGLRVSGLLSGDLRLLELIPVHADPGGTPSAEERLFQEPVRDEETQGGETLNNDWRDHVMPELRTEFSRQLEVLTEDLKRARSSGGKDGPRFEFVIPFENVEAWYGALNQARLVMQERYRFPETESPEALIGLLHSPNLKPFLTSRFYVQLQSALLDLAMDR